MLCEYCSLRINEKERKKKCKKKVGLLNRCSDFEWSDVFWCKTLKTWATLTFCQYKVVNTMDGCTKNCHQRIELMATGQKYLDPFPYLERLRKQNFGGHIKSLQKYIDERSKRRAEGKPVLERRDTWKK